MAISKSLSSKIHDAYKDMSPYVHWPDVHPVFEKFWREWGWVCRPFKKFVMYPAALGGKIGTRIWVPAEAVLPDRDLGRGIEFIKLRLTGRKWFEKTYKSTAYYRRKLRLSSAKAAEKFTRKFIRIIDSINDHGWVEEAGDPHAIPWIFRHRNILVRQDGFHRMCVLRYLGVRSLEVNEIRSHECVKLDFPDKRMRKAFMTIFQDGVGV